MTTTVILKNVRISYPNLFVAREYKAGDGKFRWSATFLIEPGSENDKAVQAAIEADAKAAWGTKSTAMLKMLASQSNKYPYLDGNTKPGEECRDMMVLASHRSNKLSRPAIIDRDKSPLTFEDGKPYAGCYVNAKVEIYCQTEDNAGVRSSFQVVQFSKDGEAFGAGVPTTDDFADVSSGADAESLM